MSLYTDIKWGLIKNVITFPLIIIGWGFGFIAGVKLGLINILASCLIGLLATRIGKIGAGDIKLIVGVSACLHLRLGFIFLAAFYMVLACSAILNRLRIYNFNPISTIKSIKKELLLEMGGLGTDAAEIAHGKNMERIGAPIILIALILTLARDFFGGFLYGAF